MSDIKQKSEVAHDAIMLSNIVAKRKSVKITFLDGEYLIGTLKWHTAASIGLKSGKVVNKNAIKYWEVIEEI